MNEPKPISPDAGAKAAAPSHGGVAGQPVQPAAVPVAASQSIALFGGHRGGGKKRADGLMAGSPEAKEADRRADAERKRVERAQKKVAALPAALPSVAPPTANPPAAVAGDSPAVSAPVAPVAGPAGAPPMFVPWQQRLLEKPARLLTKIADRFRVWSLMQRVRKLGLTREQQKEIEEGLVWKATAVEDFNVALAEFATVELNKRMVPGAQNSHYIAVVMTGGELIYAHMDALQRLEKMVLANQAASAPPIPKPEEKK